MDVPQEDYLKAIYLLGRSGNAATVTALAKRLAVSPASVTEMLARLHSRGLVERSPRKPARLTDEGEKLALRVIRRHRLLEQFLYRILGMPWDQVHEEAEALEHAISPRLEARIYEILGYPTRDPHGDPIPSEDLSMAQDAECIRLDDLPVGDCGKVIRVLVQEPDRLRYLGGRGLYPEARVEIIGKEPFDGPIKLRVNGEEVWLGRDMAHGMCIRLEKDVERENSDTT